ncbi:MAG: hypothetical protein KQ78_02110 [Candidatus Izimaplasma bacterium HR2]|nr:MAG: hypothetical protein KQ78_02110 [Candidatus Izimaplasma bacterium HR2]
MVKGQKYEMCKPTKYTFEYCFNEVKLLFDMVYSEGSKVLSLQDMVKKRPYSVQRWSEWKKNEKFKLEPEYDDFSEAIKKIEEELENRLDMLALSGQVNTTMAIFIKKTKYKRIEHGKKYNELPEKETTDQDKEITEIEDSMTATEASKIYNEMIKNSKE